MNCVIKWTKCDIFSFTLLSFQADGVTKIQYIWDLAQIVYIHAFVTQRLIYLYFNIKKIISHFRLNEPAKMNAFCWQHGAQKYSLHKPFFLPVNKNSVCWTPNPDCKNSTYCSASCFFPLWHISFFLNNPEAWKRTLSTFTFSFFPFACSFGLLCKQAINVVNICGWRMMMTIKMLAQQDVYKTLTVQFLSFSLWTYF